MPALGHEEVRRLDVAMNNSPGVRGVKGIGDLHRQRKQELDFKRPHADLVLERRAFQIFHGDKGFSILLADIVNRADVWMVQGGSSLRFALETAQRERITRDFIGKKFESNEAVQPSIFGLINHPHAAAAKFLDDAVVRYDLPDHGRILRANQHQVNESEGFKGVQGVRSASKE